MKRKFTKYPITASKTTRRRSRGPVMSGQAVNGKIPAEFSHIYRAASVKDVCNALGCDPDDLISLDELEAYDTKHVAWAIARDRYYDVLDDSGYGVVEFVYEGGDVFPAIGSAGALEDIGDEVFDIVADADEEE